MKKLTTLGCMIALLVSLSTQVRAEENLPDVQYYGYKIVHHMGAVVDHIEKFVCPTITSTSP